MASLLGILQGKLLTSSLKLQNPPLSVLFPKHPAHCVAGYLVVQPCIRWASIINLRVHLSYTNNLAGNEAWQVLQLTTQSFAFVTTIYIYIYVYISKRLGRCFSSPHNPLHLLLLYIYIYIRICEGKDISV